MCVKYKVIEVCEVCCWMLYSGKKGWLSGVITGYQGLSRVIRGYHGLSGVIMGYYSLSGVITGYQGLSRVIMGLSQGNTHIHRHSEKHAFSYTITFLQSVDDSQQTRDDS